MDKLKAYQQLFNWKKSCAPCHATGVLRPSAERADFYGEAPTKCTHCLGHKEVPVLRSIRKRCPVCGGVGRRGDGVCGACGGNVFEDKGGCGYVVIQDPMLLMEGLESCGVRKEEFYRTANFPITKKYWCTLIDSDEDVIGHGEGNTHIEALLNAGLSLMKGVQDGKIRLS